jgi:hypothetical protein
MSNRTLNKSPHAALLTAIEAFLIRHKMSAYDFGCLVGKDSALVYRLRKGREPRYALREKVWKFMKEYRG